MKLSKTTRAAEWLEQFESDDRAAAVALLDAVRFVPGGDLIAGVRGSVERFIAKDPQRTPVALVPVLSIEDMRRGASTDIDAEPIVFESFDPAQSIDNEPGSEALIAHLIREVRRGSARASVVRPPLSLEAMKSAKVRTLICVTDYIGSGQQVLDYVATWCRNATIKSWRSFGWLRVVVIAYAATAAGKRTVESSPLIDGLDVIEVAPGIEGVKSPYVDPKVAEVCRIYARRGRVSPALGHRNSAGLFASSYSVPNNLPAILIRRSSRWSPFFEGRSVSADLSREIGDHRPDVDLAQQLQDAGQLRLAARQRDGHIERRWRSHVAVLGLLPRTDEGLALALGTDLPAVREILTSLERVHLIDGTGKLTSAGRKALDVHRRKPRRVSASLIPDPSPYYPRYTR